MKRLSDNWRVRTMKSFALLPLATVVLATCDWPTQPESDAPAGPPQFTIVAGIAITDLGTLGGPFSGAGAINDQGQIVGLETQPPRPSPSKVLAELMEWSDGQFGFRFEPVGREDAVGISTSALLMHLARRKDESSRQG